MTSVISEIIDSKSRYTREHSSGLSKKIEMASDYYKISEYVKYQLMIAADLHDIGKLAISNDIIDKNGKLTKSEYEIVKSHSYYTKKALECMDSFSNIAKWASQHHEKLNGTGYPFGLHADQIDFESRLLACFDIYQALTEDRPYRKAMDHNRAMLILRDMANNGDVDDQIVEDMSIILKEKDIVI